MERAAQAVKERKGGFSKARDGLISDPALFLPGPIEGYQMMIIAAVLGRPVSANAGVHSVERRVHLRLARQDRPSPADGTLAPVAPGSKAEMLGWQFPSAPGPTLWEIEQCQLWNKLRF